MLRPFLSSSSFFYFRSLVPLFALSSFTRSATAAAMSTSFNTQRSGQGLITVAPKNEQDQSGLVVICHGLGDSAEGFVDVAEMLAKQFPYLKIVLPTAPTQSVTMNMGMAMPSWYDITGLDERSNEKCPGIQESRKVLENILETEHGTLQLPYSRMVLMGFSQGGALSLFTGLQYKEALAGIVVLSGYLPAVAQCTMSQPNTAILHCHGTADPMVTHAMALKTKEVLLQRGIRNYELKSFPGLQHTVSMDELKHVQKFLQKVLPQDDTCRVQLKNVAEMSVKELSVAIQKAGLSHKAVGFMEKQEFVKLLQAHRNGTL